MTTGPRDYLLARFRTDADALRQRADALRVTPRRAGGGSASDASQPVPGPDAATSARMAAACDEVVAMLTAIHDTGDPTTLLSSITALSPLLDLRAEREVSSPAVRAVYAGAATRIREVQQVEATARGLLA